MNIKKLFLLLLMLSGIFPAYAVHDQKQNGAKFELYLDKLVDQAVQETQEDKKSLDKFNKLIQQKDKYCGICLEAIDKNLYVTDCNHIYHRKCLVNWNKSGEKNAKKCPSCRKLYTIPPSTGFKFPLEVGPREKENFYEKHSIVIPSAPISSFICVAVPYLIKIPDTVLSTKKRLALALSVTGLTLWASKSIADWEFCSLLHDNQVAWHPYSWSSDYRKLLRLRLVNAGIKDLLLRDVLRVNTIIFLLALIGEHV